MNLDKYELLIRRNDLSTCQLLKAFSVNYTNSEDLKSVPGLQFDGSYISSSLSNVILPIMTGRNDTEI